MLRHFYQLIILTLTFFISLCVFSQEIALEPKLMLEKMQHARNELNYELSFVISTSNEIESLRYRHATLNQKNYAQLVTLDGSMQEIVQRDDVISYFQPNYQAFSVTAHHIVDSFPSILWGDIERLSKHYDFINFGRNRVANRLVRTIRVLPKDDFRYQYLLFIDEENNLLLRSDLMDREGNLLEQFRVVNFYSGDVLKDLPDYLEKVHFPPLLAEKNQDNTIPISFNWEPTWLPNGFHLVNKQIIIENGNKIETLLYSDGLFSFNLHVSNSLILKEEKALQQGAITIYTKNQNNKELTLIGQLPISTARRIIQDIKFK